MTPSGESQRQRVDRLLAALWEGLEARERVMYEGPVQEIVALDAVNARTIDALESARSDTSGDLQQEISDALAVSAACEEGFHAAASQPGRDWRGRRG